MIDGDTLVAAKNKLASVDWDFAESTDRSLIHGIHPYPAKFIPQIPRELIRLFHPGDGSAVLDPFCGSGTSLVEAMSAGLRAVGIDVNPLATLIAKVKTTPLRWAIAPVARTLVAQAPTVRAEIPRIPRLNHWFSQDVQESLSRLTKLIQSVEDASIRDALQVAVSRIMVRVSNQESDTRYAAVRKGIAGDQVYDLFIRSAELIDKAMMEAYGGLLAPNSTCKVINKSVLEVEPRELGQNYGLVVTSPPYPNAYEYWLYHKYRMYWLGMDPLRVREAEIGARPHYFKKNPQTETDFEQQMGQCFKLLAKVMVPGALACLLVGRSIIRGRWINNQALMERAAAGHGLRLLTSVSRRIALKQKAFNPAHGAINEEAIMLFVSEVPKQ